MKRLIKCSHVDHPVEVCDVCVSWDAAESDPCEHSPIAPCQGCLMKRIATICRNSTRSSTPKVHHRLRLPGPITRLFELDLARKIAMGIDDPDAEDAEDGVVMEHETVRGRYGTETVRIDISKQSSLAEECRRGRS